MKRIALIVAMGACLAFGLFTAFAVAGSGDKPKGGDNPCGPSEHGVYDQHGNFLRCEHNGDGGGNCGQNQSENGGDKGYGNKGDCTETVTTTTTETTTTETTTTEPPTTTTTTQETTTSPPTTTTTEPTTETTTEPPTSTTTTTSTTEVPPTVTPPPTKKKLEKQLKKQGEKANPNHVTTAHPQAAGELPNTGLPLGAVVALGVLLMGAGLYLRRTT